MKVDIKVSGKTYPVNFSISPGRGDTHFTAMAKSSKELDILQQAISDRNAGDEVIGVIIAKAIEKKLKLPVDFDYGYNGAGFGFKLDLYSIAKTLG